MVSVECVRESLGEQPLLLLLVPLRLVMDLLHVLP